MRRLPIAGALAALTLGLVACGTTGTEEATTSSSAASVTTSGGGSSQKPAKDTTTTTRKPRTKIKAQPDCQAYAAFSIGYSAITLAKPEQREAVVVKFQPLVEKLKQETPQFASDIDTINFMASKISTGGGLTAEDKATLSKAFEGLKGWNTATCILPPS